MKLNRMLIILIALTASLFCAFAVGSAAEKTVVKWEAKDEVVEEEIQVNENKTLPLYVIKGDGLDAVGMTDVDDGAYEVVKVFGNTAITTANTDNWQYLYFRVSDETVSSLDRGYSAQVKVTYFDAAIIGQYGCHYDSWNPEGDLDGAFTFTGFRWTEAGNKVRTTVLDLKDVRFAKREQDCADFRIAFYVTPGFAMKIISVEVEIWESGDDNAELVWK